MSDTVQNMENIYFELLMKKFSKTRISRTVLLDLTSTLCNLAPTILLHNLALAIEFCTHSAVKMYVTNLHSAKSMSIEAERSGEVNFVQLFS